MNGSGSRRVLVATADALGVELAGPGIRAWHVAQALASDHDVVLVTTGAAGRTGNGFAVRSVDRRELEGLVDWCDVLVFQGWFLVGRPYITDSDTVIVADMYDPMHLEQLEQARDAGDPERRRAVARTTAVLNEQLLRADYVVCASEKQRDFWLGAAAALGRVNPVTYDDDPSIRSLVDVVPFGVGDEAPERTGRGAKGVVPGIDPGDELVLWGGGVYNWFDPLSLIRAVDSLRYRRPRLRLLFLGLRHPNPQIPTMRMAVEARALSKELGLDGRHVFFNDAWVPYEERVNFLLDADVGVSIHFENVEAEFSFRTRILDYLWASLPVLTTEGDTLAQLVDAHGAGLTVPAEDPVAIEAALERLLGDDALAASCRVAAGTLGRELRWSQVLTPLLEFCRSPRRASDLVDPELGRTLRRARVALTPQTGTGWRYDVQLTRRYLFEGGPSLLARRVASRTRRIWSER